MNVILLKIYTRRNRGSAEQIFQIIMEKNLSRKAIGFLKRNFSQGCLVINRYRINFAKDSIVEKITDSLNMLHLSITNLS